MKPIYFKRCLHSQTHAHKHRERHTRTHNIKLSRMGVCQRYFYIQPTRGTTEAGENGQSIIIRREEQRWRRKKAAVLSPRCRDNKIKPCVIHLWHSAPHPPTTISAGSCTQPLSLVFLSFFSYKLLFQMLCMKNLYIYITVSNYHHELNFPSYFGTDAQTVYIDSLASNLYRSLIFWKRNQ